MFGYVDSGGSGAAFHGECIMDADCGRSDLLRGVGDSGTAGWVRAEGLRLSLWDRKRF